MAASSLQANISIAPWEVPGSVSAHPNQTLQPAGQEAQCGQAWVTSRTDPPKKRCSVTQRKKNEPPGGQNSSSPLQFPVPFQFWSPVTGATWLGEAERRSQYHLEFLTVGAIMCRRPSMKILHGFSVGFKTKCGRRILVCNEALWRWGINE